MKLWATSKDLQFNPKKKDAPGHAKYMKGEIWAQRILIESIKDSIIPYVSKLETAKELYEKLVELFSVRTAGEVISLRQELLLWNQLQK